MGAAEMALEWAGGAEDDECGGVPETASRLELVKPARCEASSGFVYDGAVAGRALRAGLSRRYARTLPLPMEEVLLYVKDTDSQHVRRSADPADKRAWRRMVGWGFVGVVALVLAVGPRAWLRHSSYRQAELVDQRTELREIQDHLRVRHAQVSDLRRVMVRAADAGLQAPTGDRFLWQAPDAAERRAGGGGSCGL